MSLGKREKPRVTGTRGDWDITPTHKRERPAPERKQRKPLPFMSAKTKSRVGERKAITSLPGQCVLAHLGGCDGLVDNHEIVRRSSMREAAYMPELVVKACRTHHRIDTFRRTSERFGMRIPRSVYDQDPVRAVAEAARLRVLGGRGVPYWWTDSCASMPT